jgi:serine/threonine-protein kinase
MIGEVISGKFQVERIIAQGGMGVVYACTHLHLKRKVALKILHAHLVKKDSSMERFRREAIVLAKLDNPHAVRIHDFGIHHGMPYIAMEFIDGIELADVLAEQGFLSLPRIVHMVDQTLDVLSSAHQLGIIHRDLKPANIMLCKTESKEDFVKVVDFGIAFLRDQDEPRMTQLGHVHGTAAYMSPEQCRGLDLDARSDLYSLGCVIYELISGKPPFVSDGSIEILSAHLYREPMSLRQAFPAREIPVAIEAFVMRALAKQREARFASADEMRKELARAHQESGLRKARPPRPLMPNHVFEWSMGDADSPPIALIELSMDAASRDILLTTLGASAVKSVRIEPTDSLAGYGLVMVLAQEGQQGLAVCKKLLRVPNSPPIVLCGPEDDLELMTTSIGIGIHDYVPLPLDPSDVARKVVRILRRHGKATP